MDNINWVVLDVDGVLIDVSESYDLAVKRTAEKLLNRMGYEYSVSPEEIREFRKRGQFGDDYKVTEGLVITSIVEDGEKLIEIFPKGEDINWLRKETGKEIGEETIEPIFDRLYFEGDDISGENGLWKREKPLVDTSLLKEVSDRYALGYVTGRSREEVDLASQILDFQLSNVVTREDFLKPDHRALTSLVGEENGIYAGDTYNDHLLVKNFNRKTDGEFIFVLIDQENPINTVLKELL